MWHPQATSTSQANFHSKSWVLHSTASAQNTKCNVLSNTTSLGDVPTAVYTAGHVQVTVWSTYGNVMSWKHWILHILVHTVKEGARRLVSERTVISRPWPQGCFLQATLLDLGCLRGWVHKQDGSSHLLTRGMVSSKLHLKIMPWTFLHENLTSKTFMEQGGR